MLELKNIKKAFGDCVANEDVSLTVRKGTIHAIVGENGAGKSTAMKIVYGFFNPDSGEIIFDGKPVTIRNPHDAIALRLENLGEGVKDVRIVINDQDLGSVHDVSPVRSRSYDRVF